MRIKKNLILYSVAIFILPVALFFRVIPQQLMGVNVDYYLLIITISLLFFKFLKNNKIKNMKVPIFIIMVFVWIPISTCINGSILISILGAFVYFLPYFYMFLIVNVYDNFDILDLCKAIVISSVVMAIFGLYQRYVDMSLFGIADRVNINYTKEYLSRATYYRVSSFFQSYQVFALFQGLSIVLIVSFRDVLFSKRKLIIFGSVIFLSGILSGSQIFVLVVGVWLTFEILKRMKYCNVNLNRKKAVHILMILVFALAIFVVYKDEFERIAENSFRRLFLIFRDFSGFLSYESIRWNKISVVFKMNPINFLFGNGLGTSSYLAKNILGDVVEQYTTESFLFSIWYEMGVFGFIFFVVFMIKTIFDLVKNNSPLSQYVLCGFVAMIFTPTFYTIPMLPMFSILFYGVLGKVGIFENDGSIAGL